MVDYDFDLFVIGAGSGGVRAARECARRGARVAVAEERYLGGTCVNVGCIPKKLFVHASEFSRSFRDALGYGWRAGEPAFDWATLRHNKDREIERLNGIYARLLDEAGVTRLDGRAEIADPHGIRIDGRHYSARYILVATGGWPHVPDIPGRELVVDSNQVFHLEHWPRRVVIVGGGYIAVEFAGIFNGLGVETHLVYRRSLFLRGFDRDIRQELADQMRAQGVYLHFDTNVTAITESGEGLSATLDDGGSLEVDTVMYATGRNPNTLGLGLENTAVVMDDNGVVEVDEHYRTAEPSIYALGDVTGGLELTPVAINEAMALAGHLFGDGGDMDYEGVPTAIFSQPPLATVGLTEEQARERELDVAVYRTGFRALKQTLTGGPERVLMKLVVERHSDRVLGCHMLGEEAAEIIQGLAVALKAGATKADFDNTVGIHPTVAEEFVTMREPVA